MFALTLLLIIPAFCHTPKNGSDVIITYEGHAEADQPLLPREHEPKTLERTTQAVTESRADDVVTERDEVIFIPNERQRQTDDEDFLESERNIGDLFSGRKSVDDVMRNVNDLDFNTENPQTRSDVVFVTGKNNAEVEDSVSREKNKQEKHRESPRRVAGKDSKPKVNCAKLECSKNISSVCGSKRENNSWKYRLFLNQCYLNKVNCGFKYDINKYTKVPRYLCNKVGAHNTPRPYAYHPAPPGSSRKKVDDEYDKENRRSFISRRSTTLDATGAFCGHSCPVSCGQHYDPQCAVSATGHSRVFPSHCHMDMNSCMFGVVWQQRHLAECIGTEQADLRTNRAFISWMQRVGIIDARGKFVTE